jgi:fructose-1,6-bisphosphatase/inositol monophosphatase family enzyme
MSLTSKVEGLLREVSAAIIMPRFQRLAAGEIVEKTPGELVTIADRESEIRLDAGLRALLPGSVVVGEEAVAADPATIERLSMDAPVWLIDPVDGTANFAAGRAPFGVMVALVRGGETVAGWIFDPLDNTMAVSERGAGAFVDGVRLRTSPANVAWGDLRGAALSRFFTPTERANIMKASAGLGALLPGFNCAAREYVEIASGRQHFAAFRRVLPWDHAPGVLLVLEAGGTALKLDGRAYVPADTSPGLLMAQNAPMWREVRGRLLADFV